MIEKDAYYTAFRLIFKLSEFRRTYERQPYTVITLVSDIGGFNGAILYITAVLLSSYSNRQY